MSSAELAAPPAGLADAPADDVPALLRALLRHVVYAGAVLLLLAGAGALLAR
ncbi:hypothetical protein HLB44_20335 [Aquincola sp. S2]|uniref:Uncharacterized protein n=1 Tax=Pseudaquabacterium terrae TaxID=2732868 RepID=A0ABX2EL17_9BURK|nr:hypothetical protein [Aquabacterium terrae]NRF69351.1 hypothetical protein [Aquabacterium terrae]